MRERAAGVGGEQAVEQLLWIGRSNPSTIDHNGKAWPGRVDGWTHVPVHAQILAGHHQYEVQLKIVEMRPIAAHLRRLLKVCL